MTRPRASRTIWIAGATALFLALVGGALLWWRSSRSAPVLPVGTVEFYGLVVDDEGKPLPGATAVALIFESKHRGDAPAKRYSETVNGQVEDVEFGPASPGYHYKLRRLRVNSDAAGRFHIQRPGQSILIFTIRKNGYTWLTDLAWDATAFVCREGDCPPNNGYAFAPDPEAAAQFSYLPQWIYLPDPARPAIFPMLRPDATQAPAPSRGGADRILPDGRIRQNVPVAPLVPNTGPGYTKNEQERIKKVREIHRAVNAEMTRLAALQGKQPAMLLSE